MTPENSREDRGMDVSSLSVGLFKVNFPVVSSCASSVVKAVLFLFKNLNGNRIMYGKKKKRSTLTFNQFRPPVPFSKRCLPSSGGKLKGFLTAQVLLRST